MGCTDSKEEPKKQEPPVAKKPQEEKKKEEPPVSNNPHPEKASSPAPPSPAPPAPTPTPPPPPPTQQKQHQEPTTPHDDPPSPLLPSPSVSPAPKPKIFAFFPGAGGCIDMMRPVLDSCPQEEKNDPESTVNKYLSHVSFVQSFEGDGAQEVTDEQLEQIIADTPPAVLENVSLIDISGCDKLTVVGIAELINACAKDKIRALYAFPLPACLTSSAVAALSKESVEIVAKILSQLTSLSIIYAYDASTSTSDSNQHQHQNPILQIAVQITKRNKKSALNWTTLSSVVAASSMPNGKNNDNNIRRDGAAYVAAQDVFGEPTIVIDGVAYTEMDCLFEAIELNKPQESGRAWYDLGVLISHHQDQQQLQSPNNNNNTDNKLAEINSVSMMMMNASFNFAAAHQIVSPANSGALGDNQNQQSALTSPQRGSIPPNNVAAVGGEVRSVPTVERNGVPHSSRACFIKSIECDPTCSYSWVGLGIDLLSYAAAVENSEGARCAPNVRLTATTVPIRLPGSNQTPIRVSAKECFIRSLSLHNDNAFAWANLGNLLRIPLDMLSETQKIQIPRDDFETYEEFTYAKILVNNNISSSNNNNNKNNSTNEKIETNFSKIDCYVRCLELDPTRIKTWNNLGAALGACGSEATAFIRGSNYTKKDCLVRSIELSDGKDFATWMNLGAMLNSNQTDVAGGMQFIPHLENSSKPDRKFSKKDCLIEALKINADLKPAWKSLAMLVVLNPDGTSGAADPATLTKETIMIGETSYTKLEILKRAV